METEKHRECTVLKVYMHSDYITRFANTIHYAKYDTRAVFTNMVYL